MSPAPTTHDVAQGVDERHTTRGVVRGTAANFLAIGLQMAVGFVTTPFFIDRLGVAAYGIYTLVLVFTVSGYFGNIDLGLQSALVHRASPHAAHARWQEFSRVASSAGLMIGVVTLSVAAVLALLAGPLAYDVFDVPARLEGTLENAFYVAALVLALQAPTFVCTGVLQTLQRHDVIVAIRGFFSLVAVGIAVVLVAEGASVMGLIVPVVLAPVAWMVASVIASYRLVPHFGPWPWLATRAEMRELRRFARVILLAQAGAIVASNLDRILIGAFLGARTLGIYGIAAVIYSTVAAVYLITTSTVFAATSQLYARGDQARLRELLVRGTRYAGSLTLVAGVAAALFGPPFVDAWVGRQYHEAGILLLIWLTPFAITAFVGIAQNALPALGRAGTAARVSAASAALNLGASLVLMGPFGARGIVAGTAIAQIATAPVLLSVAVSVTGTGRREFVRRAIVPSYVAGLVALAVGVAYRLALEPVGILSLIAGGALTTAAGVAVAGALLSRGERDLLIAAFRDRLSRSG